MPPSRLAATPGRREPAARGDGSRAVQRRPHLIERDRWDRVSQPPSGRAFEATCKKGVDGPQQSGLIFACRKLVDVAQLAKKGTLDGEVVAMRAGEPEKLIGGDGECRGDVDDEVAVESENTPLVVRKRDCEIPSLPDSSTWVMPRSRRIWARFRPIVRVGLSTSDGRLLGMTEAIISPPDR